MVEGIFLPFENYDKNCEKVYKNSKILDFFLKIEPGLVLNLFLNFG